MNAYVQTIDVSSAHVADPDRLHSPEAAALRLLAEWFSGTEEAPPDLAERAILFCTRFDRDRER